MPVEAIAMPEKIAPAYADAGYPLRKRWTRSDCQAIESTGLWEHEKLELIAGDLIDKMSKNRPHVNVMLLVMEWLVRVFGARYVTSEAPIDVAPEDNPTNEPQPDLAVLVRPYLAFESSNPPPSDVRLVVEISDTLAFDLRTKARLYARAGIQEYWVVDVTGRRIFVHRAPRAGVYETITSHNPGESIEPLSAPGSSFNVDDAFLPLTASGTRSATS